MLWGHLARQQCSRSLNIWMHWTLLSAQALPLTAGTEARAVGQRESPSKSLPSPTGIRAQGSMASSCSRREEPLSSRPAVLDRLFPLLKTSFFQAC